MPFSISATPRSLDVILTSDQQRQQQCATLAQSDDTREFEDSSEIAVLEITLESYRRHLKKQRQTAFTMSTEPPIYDAEYDDDTDMTDFDFLAKKEYDEISQGVTCT
ncbi:uncharacterized protein PHALS_04222 [Plasmopara halstedii]|uniref:Uncharacterized protein n=1 Tax=Plasmopara halstedii TaxID=4781 RepID=A0A0P1A959_PLAHL|nr:uncharacterized protein PHALS_04222 [Plasmopara halstedii]CEG36974.1 hypothetical protein PHALS_04222 [Plasmopara halstedii]|eukprot:XP_024573343.1 hypothetical protein PHALS_04222 [Plasmopara halstedii]